MSEEIAAADATLAELARVRTERDLIRDALRQVEASLASERTARAAFEADAAQLRMAALAVVRAVSYTERFKARAELQVLATVAHPGTLILQELDAARAIVACWRRQPPYYDDCDPGQNDPYYAWNVEMIDLVVAHDAIVKGGGA